ncbi:hypothetical protein EON65_37390 [archaeon]|nr:MAG: hypothetical protein EON65_37390 [archaeon]
MCRLGFFWQPFRASGSGWHRSRPLWFLNKQKDAKREKSGSGMTMRLRRSMAKASERIRRAMTRRKPRRTRVGTTGDLKELFIHK